MSDQPVQGMNGAAPSVSTVDAQELAFLREVLGIRQLQPEVKWGLRNLHAAAPGQQDPCLNSLLEKGLMVAGGSGEVAVFFHATLAGCKVAGLPDEEAEIAAVVERPDDFLRIHYTRPVAGKARSTSVSIDPDLFLLFAKLLNSASGARQTLRNWAIEIDAQGAGRPGRIGVSRMVQRRIYQELAETLDRGLHVR